MQKYLIIKGCAGLGNRLITLANAIEYAKITNRIIYVDWSDGQFAPKGVNAFYKYFRLENVRYVCDIEEIIGLNFSIYPSLFKDNLHTPLYELYFSGESNFLRRLINYFPISGNFSKLNKFWYPLGRSMELLPVKSDFISLKALFSKKYMPFGENLSRKISEDIVVFADYAPNFNSNKFLQNIKLNSEWEEFILKKYQTLIGCKETIGVHIRFSDKQPTNELVNLEELINSLYNNNKWIFLSTDNGEIENWMKQKYERVIVADKLLPKLSNQGLHQYAKASNDVNIINSMFRDSLVDMWLLSKCSFLIAQKNSSFSLVSSIIKNKIDQTYFW